MLKIIEKHQKQIGINRDKLDEDINTLEELREACSGAWEALQEARDRLSELV